MRSIKLPSWTERLLGLEPVPAPAAVFAIDGRHLRFGQFDRAAEGTSFEAYRLWELAKGAFGEGPLGAPLREPTVFAEWLAGIVEPLLPAAREATLVLPDSWLRLTFTEVAELPKAEKLRDEVLRWKLKRLVPFRVEELRVQAVDVPALPGQQDPIRLLVGFGIEVLLRQLEDAFQSAGVRVGFITNTTLAALAGLEKVLDPSALSAVVLVDEHAYTVTYLRGGAPLLYRYKEIGDVPYHERAATVRRDLRLTQSFMAEAVPDTGLSRLLLTAPLDDEEAWTGWLYDELGVTSETLSFEHFALTRAQADLSWSETAALYGAAALEVA